MFTWKLKFNPKIDLLSLILTGVDSGWQSLPERWSMVEVGVLLRMLNLLVQPWLLKEGWMKGWVDHFRIGGTYILCEQNLSDHIGNVKSLANKRWMETFMRCYKTIQCNLQWMVVYWYNARGEIYSKRITREEIHSRLTGEQSMHLLKLSQSAFLN